MPFPSPFPSPSPSPARLAPVLILSTGRCGSTMISDLLNRHPAVLSLSEFFVTLGNEGLAWKRPDGERMWRLLSRQGPGLSAMLRDGIVVDEALYPYDRPGARFTARTMPPVMVTALPHLTPDHEALYDSLEPVVRSWPRRPLADQYRALFDHLCDRFGRRVWVERSGGSLMSAAKLLHLFPEARVIHVYRDGRDTALSMARHHNFRVLAALARMFARIGVDPWRGALSPTIGHAETLFFRLLLRLLNTRRLAGAPIPLAEFGSLWANMIETGERAMAALPAERRLDVRIEDVQNAPRETLRRLIRFIDPSLEDEAWLDAVETVPRPVRARYQSLPEEERRALTAACAPGLDRLGYAP